MVIDALLSRWQLREVTGLPDATLDYWSRNGVLRTAQGGGGKGQHRRFASPEVMLAGILGELLKFGVAASSLAALAERFHSSLDWIDRHGVAESVRLIPELMENWEEFASQGEVEVFDPIIYDPAKPFRTVGEGRAIRSWEEVVAYQQGRHEGLTDQAVRIATEIPKSEFIPHAQRYLALRSTPRSRKTVHELILFKQDDGEWGEHLLDPQGRTSKRSPDNLETVGQLSSYFTIDLASLRRRLWGAPGQ